MTVFTKFFFFLYSGLAFAGAPSVITFQSKILTPSGAALESANVSFRMTVLDSAGTCVLFVEDFANKDMTGSQGVVSLPLGTGTKVYPPAATNLYEVFNNSMTFNCQAGGTSSPSGTDNRQVVMQFNDGSGWQTLPQMAVNAVPFANYATRAESLGAFAATDYLRPTTLPTCSAGQSLRWDGSVFTCIAAGGGGSTYTGVTNISNASGDITLAPASGTGAVLITSNTPSTSTTTGSVVITGGVGATGAINAGGNITSNGSVSATSMLSMNSIFTPQLYGTSTPSGNIRIDGTSDATKGNVLLATAGGNVGIGTNAPAYKLHVVGTELVEGGLSIFDSSAGNNGLEISTNSSAPRIDFRSAGSYSAQIAVDSNKDLFIKNTINKDTIFTGGATGTTELMRLKNTGNVGIGTTTPSSKLAVVGDINITGNYLVNGVAMSGGGGGPTLNGITNISNSSGDITLAPATGTGAVQINSGAASISPSTGALVINGGVGVSGGVYSGGAISSGSTVSAVTSMFTPQLYGTSTPSGSIRIDGTSNATKGDVLLASAGGNVGIGTTSPGAKLSVEVSDSSTNQALSGWSTNIVNSDQTANNWVGLAFMDAQTGILAASIQTKFTDHTNNYGELHLGTRGAGGWASRLMIDQNGNVGIGTTTPEYALTVSKLNATPGKTVFIQDPTPTTGITSLVLQSGAAQANNAIFEVKNIGGDTVFAIDWNPNNSSSTVFTDDIRAMGRELNLYGNQYSGQTGNLVVVSDISGTRQPTTGVAQSLVVDGSFSPTSGSAVENILAINGIINQTGGANGITRGIYVDPTLTSAADFRAIETVRGHVLLGTTSGSVAVGTTTPVAAAKLFVQGQIVSGQNTVAAGATVDFSTGNVQVVQNPGGSAITLNNMIDGGSYTVVITDTTSRTYTFTNCTTSRFVPANEPTSGRTVYSILKTTESGTVNCYISWIPGF